MVITLTGILEALKLSTKGVVDEALKNSDCVKNVLTVMRTGSDIDMDM